MTKQTATPAFGSVDPLGTLLAVIDRRERGLCPFLPYRWSSRTVRIARSSADVIYNTYHEQKQRFKELQTVKRNIDQILRREEPHRRKEQSHER